jgi:hypothetical protein
MTVSMNASIKEVEEQLKYMQDLQATRSPARGRIFIATPVQADEAGGQGQQQVHIQAETPPTGKPPGSKPARCKLTRRRLVIGALVTGALVAGGATLLALRTRIGTWG